MHVYNIYDEITGCHNTVLVTKDDWLTSDDGEQKERETIMKDEKVKETITETLGDKKGVGIIKKKNP